MSAQTKIQWATHTFNPWIGCTKVSPGCLNCYAEHTTLARVKRSRGTEIWGKGAPRHRTSKATWKQPERWQHQAITPTHVNWQCCDDCGEPAKKFPPRPRVFPSLCDWLDPEVPIEWLADFLRLIHETPNVDWLLLTKRPEQFQNRLSQVRVHWGIHGCYDLKYYDLVDQWKRDVPPTNVWFGVSVEDQKRADERIPKLLQIPARVRFLSVEPLLGLVDLKDWLGEKELMSYSAFNSTAHAAGGVDWVIVGGESGPKARPCRAEWIRDIITQCRAQNVPVFVKQMGANCWSRLDDFKCPMTDAGQADVDWRAHFKHPKGGDPAEWPRHFRLHEFPNPMSREGAREAKA